MNFADIPCKGVYFDFGGVISVSPMPTWPLTFYPYCATVGLRPEHITGGFAKYRKLWDGDAISFDEMYGRIFADAGLPAPTKDVLAEIRRLDAASWAAELRPETLELAKAFKAAGKRLGILSNMSSDFYSEFFAPRCAAFRALVDVEIISGHERVCKPEAEIFARAAARMGLAPADLLFLDDTEENVLAARACGWQAELYR